MNEWDVSLKPAGGTGGRIHIWVPMAVSRALVDAGFNRATLRVTPAGLLLIPYKSDNKKAQVELPKEWT